MTLEEAIKEAEKIGGHPYSQESQDAQELVNKIYDDFENRSCDGCEHIDKNYKLEQWSTYTYNYCNKQEIIIDGVDDFCCNKFKPKDTQ